MVSFASKAAPAVRAVTTAEAACCGFLHLAVVEADEVVWVELRSDAPEARPVIERLVAAASGQARGPFSR